MAPAPAVGTEGQDVPNRRVILKRHVTGFPSEDDMEVVAGGARLAVPPGSAAVVLKNLYLSCDPYMRGRMSMQNRRSYVPVFVPGEILVGHGVSRVVASGHPDFEVGDHVWGMTGWEEYTLIPNPESLFKTNHPEMPLSYYTGVLGMPGLTAYAGLYDVAKPKKGDYVFVSAASGAVGQIVGQLAKLAGCYVVGSAGSDEKVKLLEPSLALMKLSITRNSRTSMLHCRGTSQRASTFTSRMWVAQCWMLCCSTCACMAALLYVE
ncbi:unnamed protein product [Urochloa decumbens]|uniref:Oxidoreductase N-terminal domain-containing protein n=1 Tax=Urochloa decumbens TaxID=240449 RepID=A0ABC8W7X0_9POAL